MELKPYKNNAKKHPEKQLREIANSIKEFGWQQPIVVDKDGVIIVGHGRYFAYEKYKDELPEPDVRVTDLSEEQAKAYRLADNKLNESDWDMDLVIEELKDLSSSMVDLTGFDKDLLIEPEDKDDEVPEVPEEPKSKLGDTYQLGEHRVMCGDSTDLGLVGQLTEGKNDIDVSFTSPPYNVGHNLGYEGKDSKYIHSDDDSDYVELIKQTTENSIVVAKDVFVNLQILANNKKDVLVWLSSLAEYFKDIFFWKKLQVAPAMAERVANSQTELIVLFGNNNSRAWGNKKWRGNFSNSIETKSASGENKNAEKHNATFPVELPLTFLKQGYKEGSKVLDLFAGTGTTMIACEKLGMKCYMMELEPSYVDVIIKRWEDYTGQKTKKVI